MRTYENTLTDAQWLRSERMHRGMLISLRQTILIDRLTGNKINGGLLLFASTGITDDATSPTCSLNDGVLYNLSYINMSNPLTVQGRLNCTRQITAQVARR